MLELLVVLIDVAGLLEMLISPLLAKIMTEELVFPAFVSMVLAITSPIPPRILLRALD